MSESTRTRTITNAHILRKVFLTGATGGAAYVVTDLFNQPLIGSITLSAFIGGVTLVIQFLADFDDRLTKSTELFGLIEASAMRSDVVTQVARHAALIGPALPPLAQRLAQSELVRMSQFLKELGEGAETTYEGEDRDWLLGLAHNVESTIDATALTTVGATGKSMVDLGLWVSDLGQRYLEVQREAIDRGVTIRRLFILEKPELQDDPELLDLCRLQQEIGIDVRLLDPSAVPGKRRSSLFDFIIFDGVISYEMTPQSHIGLAMGRFIGTTRLVLSPYRVAERIQGFRDLWSSAHEVK